MMASTTNGNGHTNGRTNGTSNPSNPIPATHLLATFASTTTTVSLTPELREKVKEVLLDFIGVTVGALTHATSTQPIISAITALQGPTITKASPGVCTVLGLGAPRFQAQYAGLLNAALAHSLDFDDTFAPGTLHAGVTAIAASLAAFESLAQNNSPRTADDLFLAISIGYETTCRLGRELGYAAYTRGFHNTSTAGIFGAIAAIACLRRLPTEVVEHAFGLAGSKAAGSMQYLSNGSWNKRLHPGFAVHDAFMCLALAESAVIGASEILEGKSGFLSAYTPSQDVSLERLVEGLGESWIWLGSSLKPYPACRMTHGFIELSGKLHDKHVKSSRSSSDTPTEALHPDAVQRITLTMSPANYLLIGDPTPNKRHPSNNIDAQFSAYFQVAHALVYGARTGSMDAYSRLENLLIHQLTDKITVGTDARMSEFAAKMSVHWADGKTEEVDQRYPLGEVQHPFTRDLVEEKFLSLAEPVYGQERVGEIVRRIEHLDDDGEGDVLGLIELLR